VRFIRFCAAFCTPNPPGIAGGPPSALCCADASSRDRSSFLRASGQHRARRTPGCHHLGGPCRRGPARLVGGAARGACTGRRRLRSRCGIVAACDARPSGLIFLGTHGEGSVQCYLSVSPRVSPLNDSLIRAFVPEQLDHLHPRPPPASIAHFISGAARGGWLSLGRGLPPFAEGPLRLPQLVPPFPTLRFPWQVRGVASASSAAPAPIAPFMPSLVRCSRGAETWPRSLYGGAGRACCARSRCAAPCACPADEAHARLPRQLHARGPSPNILLHVHDTARLLWGLPSLQIDQLCLWYCMCPSRFSKLCLSLVHHVSGRCFVSYQDEDAPLQAIGRAGSVHSPGDSASALNGIGAIGGGVASSTVLNGGSGPSDGLPVRCTTLARRGAKDEVFGKAPCRAIRKHVR